MPTIRIIGFSDASFANNADLSTQLGHIFFLTDRDGTSVSIKLKSYNSNLIVRSAMAREVIAFRDLFDLAATLAAKVGDLLQRTIPIQILTDSKSFFGIISKGSRT